MSYILAAFADEADGRISGQIEIMKKHGVERLEIRGVDGENISDISVPKAAEVRKMLDAAGIKVWSLGSPYGKIGINDNFDAHLEKFKRGLEIAEILGTKRIRMFSFYVSSEEKNKYRDEVMRRLRLFDREAKGSGIILCHENEKGIYGDKAPECREILEAFPSIKAVFDPANFVQCGQDTIKAWEMLGDYVEYMHIKDALKDGSVVPAGKGIGNIPYLLDRYKGEVLTIEPHLSVFDGFCDLEQEKRTTMGYCFPSSEVAFGAAVNALKEIIGGENYEHN